MTRLDSKTWLEDLVKAESRRVTWLEDSVEDQVLTRPLTWRLDIQSNLTRWLENFFNLTREQTWWLGFDSSQDSIDSSFDYDWRLSGLTRFMTRSICQRLEPRLEQWKKTESHSLLSSQIKEILESASQELSQIRFNIKSPTQGTSQDLVFERVFESSNSLWLGFDQVFESSLRVESWCTVLLLH